MWIFWILTCVVLSERNASHETSLQRLVYIPSLEPFSHIPSYYLSETNKNVQAIESICSELSFPERLITLPLSGEVQEKSRGCISHPFRPPFLSFFFFFPPSFSAQLLIRMTRVCVCVQYRLVWPHHHTQISPWSSWQASAITCSAAVSCRDVHTWGCIFQRMISADNVMAELWHCDTLHLILSADLA